MKLRFLFFLGLLILIGGCSRYVAPVFTDVEKMSQLKNGMKLKQVVDVLGIEPFNIYHMQEDGSMVVAFNYRLKMRRIVVPTFNQDEYSRKTTDDESQTSGDEFYSKEYKVLYTYIRDNKLVSFTTTDGLDKSELVLLHNNNLMVINRDKVALYDNSPDSLSNAEAVRLVHGSNAFKVNVDKHSNTGNESLFRRLFKN